jgi:hypothetical protein
MAEVISGNKSVLSAASKSTNKVTGNIGLKTGGAVKARTKNIGLMTGGAVRPRLDRPGRKSGGAVMRGVLSGAHKAQS